MERQVLALKSIMSSVHQLAEKVGNIEGKVDPRGAIKV